MAFYTYLWLRANGTPYYVGKGKEWRAFMSDGHTVRRPKDATRILVQEFPSEQDALTAEIFLITYYGRLDIGTGCLRNRTNGGDGVSGLKHSTATREKISKIKKGYKYPAEVMERRKRLWKEKGYNPFLGRKHTEETKAKIRAKRALQDMSYPKSENFGKWNIGKIRSEEAKQKNREAHLGRKHSAEVRQKISDGLKKHWEYRRG